MAAIRKTATRQARAQRVGDILEAARVVFSERGYENATMAEIAARVDLVEGSVYKYFESKRELLLKVIETWYQGLVEDFARDLAGIRGVRSRLRYLVWQHLHTIRRDAQLSRLMFQEIRLKGDYHGSALYEMNRRYTGFLVDVVRDGVASGDFRADIPAALARDMVFGTVEHHTWNFLCGRGDIDVDRVADQITAMLCDGFAAKPAPAAGMMADLQRETARLARIARRMEKSTDAHAAARHP